MSNDLSAPGRKYSRTGVIITIMTLLVIVCLCVPAIQQAREAARRTQSRDQLKQIGLALSNYYDTFSRFPPGGVFGQDGTAYHGWTSSIAPYIDSSPWFNQVDFSIPWDDPRQVDLFRDWVGQQSHIWTNPSVSPVYRADGLVFGHYAGNQTIFYRNSSVDRFRYGVDSGRLLVADALGNQIPVGFPYGWRDVTLGFMASPDGFGCRPRKITQCLMADGRVDVISSRANATVIAAMAGPAEHFPDSEEVAKPRDFPLIDVNRIWRIEWVPDEDHFGKNDRVRRVPPRGWKDGRANR